MTDQNQPIPRLDPQEAVRLASAGRAVIVDVREAEELARTGKIAGALHIPLGEVVARAAAELPRDQDLCLYCAAGIRSAAAARALREMGWQRLFNLGGLGEAAAAGVPIEPASLDRGDRRRQ